LSPLDAAQGARKTPTRSEARHPTERPDLNYYRRKYLMSRNDYEVSRQIESTNPPFYALIMAAMRKADSANASLLQHAWPETVAELNYRYWSAGGFLPGEDGYSRDGDDNIAVPA